MRTIRDSRVEQLKPAEILAFGIANATPNAPEKVKALASTLALKDMSLPNTLIDQIGNTVFVVRRGTGDQEDRVQGRIYNAEPPSMLVNNLVKHIRNLHEQGVRKYRGVIHDTKLLPILKRAVKQAKREGFQINIGAYPAKDRKDTFLILAELVGGKGAQQ